LQELGDLCLVVLLHKALQTVSLEVRPEAQLVGRGVAELGDRLLVVFEALMVLLATTFALEGTQARIQRLVHHHRCLGLLQSESTVVLPWTRVLGEFHRLDLQDLHVGDLGTTHAVLWVD